MAIVRFVRDFYFRGRMYATGDTTEVEDWTAAHLLRLGNVAVVVEEDRDAGIESSEEATSAAAAVREEEVAAKVPAEAAAPAADPPVDSGTARQPDADAKGAFDRARHTGPAAGMNRSSHKLPPHGKA